jgi:hypothetical protein
MTHAPTFAGGGHASLESVPVFQKIVPVYRKGPKRPAIQGSRDVVHGG